MSGGENVETSASPKIKTSKALLLSEYKDETEAQHVVEFLSKKPKVKPIMNHVKSSVLERVKKLLPSLEQGQKDINSQNQNEYNIEDIEENTSFIEMDVAIVKASEDDESSLSENEFGDSDSSSSDSESVEVKKLYDLLGLNFNDLEKISSQNRANVSELHSLETSLCKKRKHSSAPLIEEIEDSNELNSNKATT